MRRYFIFGLMVVGLLSCTSCNVKNSGAKIEDNVTVKEKSVVTVDLDKELRADDYSKGGLRGDEKKIIPIFIGDNDDEVLLKGDVLKKVDRIKIGDNDEVAFSGTEYTIKTAKLKDGEIITIKYGKDNEIKIRVKTH